jgi:hypothetical protein
MNEKQRLHKKLYDIKYRQENIERIKKKKREYYQKNKEKIKAKLKKFREENKERLKEIRKIYFDQRKDIKREYDKIYRKKNIKRIKERHKKYYYANKEKIIKRNEEYCKKNSEKIKQRKSEYYQKNKDQKRKYDKIYCEKRYKNDLNYKIRKNLRGRICAAIKKKCGKKTIKSSELLGCSIEHVRKHLESQFKEGMTWDNHGYKGWHIDHIIPCSSFDLTDPEQQKKCFNYKNLQPLWWNDNMSKGAKIV